LVASRASVVIVLTMSRFPGGKSRARNVSWPSRSEAHLR